MTPFKVDLSGVVTGQWQSLYAQAKAKGAGKEFLTSSRQILDDLHADPAGTGEPRYHLK